MSTLILKMSVSSTISKPQNYIYMSVSKKKMKHTNYKTIPDNVHSGKTGVLIMCVIAASSANPVSLLPTAKRDKLKYSCRDFTFLFVPMLFFFCQSVFSNSTIRCLVFPIATDPCFPEWDRFGTISLWEKRSGQISLRHSVAPVVSPHCSARS